MHPNEALITKFYSAFGELDYAAMCDCYSDHAIFNDPVFGILIGREVSAMWEMLCRNAKEFSLQFSDIELLDEEYATCKWTATYLFSRTGRKVVNHIKAYMRIQEGRITEHTDHFDLWKWSRQAFGFTGIMLGWTRPFKNRIRISSKKSLDRFMNQELPGQSP